MRLPRNALAGLAIGLSLCTSATAMAEPNLDKAQAAAPAASRWYGGQSLMIDAAAILGGSALVIADPDGPLGELGVVGGLGTYAFGGPINHLAHDNPGRAGLSLLMRAGLPFTGMLIGAGSSCEGDFCQVGPVMWGGAIGVLAAVGIDAAIAWEDVAEQDGPKSAIASWSLTPVVGKSSGGISVGGLF